MSTQAISRRRFVQAGVSTLALTTLPAAMLRAAEVKVPLAIDESYLANGMRDFPGMLEALGKAGYKGYAVSVGPQVRNGGNVKKLLSDNGMTCCAYRTSVNPQQPETFQAALDYAVELGARFVWITGSIPGKTKSDWQRYADVFNGVAPLFTKAGVTLGYIPTTSFSLIMEGESPLDIFFGRAKPEVSLHLPTGGVKPNGQEFIAAAVKHAKRFKTVELFEPAGLTGIIGSGNVPWKEIFDICENKSGTQWYVVRQRHSDKEPLKSAAQNIEALRRMSKI